MARAINLDSMSNYQRERYFDRNTCKSGTGAFIVAEPPSSPGGELYVLGEYATRATAQWHVDEHARLATHWRPRVYARDELNVSYTLRARTPQAGAFEVGDRVEGGAVGTEDTGTIERLRSGRAYVAWDSGVKTWADLASLHAIGDAR